MPVQVETLKPGNGNMHPQPGNTVTCHYAIYLQDGKPLDNTRARNQPFQMAIGSGQVIRGFEEGIRRMTPGERAKFVVTPDLAFGTQGIPNAVPPNSTVIFDVELLEVK